MPPGSDLAAPLLAIALIYASVGQAGASGYIAVMGLAGMTPASMKVSALALNLVVGAIGTGQFLRAGRLSWRTVYPFALLGFPFSLLGGATYLPPHLFLPVVGVVLILSALLMARSAWKPSLASAREAAPAPFIPALVTGAVIGFVSGATGTGGGVFLAPVILAIGWGTARQTATITAVYNLLNSGAALLGAWHMWGMRRANVQHCSIPTW